MTREVTEELVSSGVKTRLTKTWGREIVRGKRGHGWLRDTDVTMTSDKKGSPRFLRLSAKLRGIVDICDVLPFLV